MLSPNDSSTKIYIDDNDYFKKSISEEIFSAKKEPTHKKLFPLNKLNFHQAMKFNLDQASHKSDYSQMNTPKEVSILSPMIAREIGSTWSSKVNSNTNIDKHENDALLEIPHFDHNNHYKTSSNLIVNNKNISRPTLAIQEDMSEYISMTHHSDTQLDRDECGLSFMKSDVINKSTKSNNDQNLSLFSESVAQMNQIFDGNFTNNLADLGRLKEIERIFFYIKKFKSYMLNYQLKIKETPAIKSRNKEYSCDRQSYVQNEENTFQNSNESHSPVSQLVGNPSWSSKKNLNDLISPTCTSQLGNPIDSFVPSVLGGYTNDRIAVVNSMSLSNKSTKSKSNGCIMMSSTSSITTRTSSILSSNEGNVNMCGETKEFGVGGAAESPPPVKYRQANVAKLINKKFHNFPNSSEAKIKTNLSNHTEADLNKDFPTTVIESESNTFVKTNLIRPRIATIEAKHETSV